MKILITGQTTLHWGRMEFGNIGNYYIIEPFVRELFRVFPEASISTTLQMSNVFCKSENVKVLPMELYYGWNVNDLTLALAELAAATIFNKTGVLPISTPYMKAVGEADIVIDLSGDIWGDNANFLGKDRFLVGLCKNRVAQLMKKRTVMIAGSPGPFADQSTLSFAKEVFAGFDLVTNREPLSIEVLKKGGFDVSKVANLACPAFLFEPATKDSIKDILFREGFATKARPKVGFILCGWNFINGPFDKWPRPDSDYSPFVEAIEKFTVNCDVDLILMSHSNGFDLPPSSFVLKHGRDYPIVKQLQEILVSRGVAKNVKSLDGVYDQWTTKAIIGQLDMLISGRIHAAVAGFSQFIPTVVIDYGHEPKAHKIQGFAMVAEQEKYVTDPKDIDNMFNCFQTVFENRIAISNILKRRIPEVKELARKNFDLIKEVLG